MYSVLFVCTGNICRSPTAEAVFRHYVESAGLSHAIQTDSAGTHGYHVGDPPDSRAVSTAQSKGFSMQGIRARKVAASDKDSFNLILAMDSGHMRILERQGFGKNTKLFLDYVPGYQGQDVPDPYYGGQDGFDHVFDLVERGSAQILEAIKGEIR
jgi:protein-tyrosine phosphatase